ncbi:HlyD family secretion protein [Bradyrhizobium sp. CB1650]|uniref:HlyD family secretion protein n=1 Tax=Bradyrhizobium sp. CB1650 TaxID=3039153 RepID=UPI00243496AE|nr:HlyD family secretion protein [Bradyrhizobium sp. CB1650]WGD55158.1 HlyD family secretion protein [Bradyrhizobium sp. CB1650]
MLETVEHEVAAGPTDGSTKAKADAAVDRDDKLSTATDPAAEPQPANRWFTLRRKLLVGVLGAVVVVAASYGIPWIRFVLSTVSTDDAFVNGHVTFIAPRVHGQVARVLVDDNNRVRKGDLLVQLDKEPFQDAVNVKKAAVDTAEADLQAAKAAVRGIEAQAMSRRWQLQQAVENVGNQIALLHARVAALNKARATLTLAQQEFDRTAKLVVSDTASHELYDQRQAALLIAKAGVVQALADANQIRVFLGLSVQPEDNPNLEEVPADLDQTFSSVLQAQAQLIQTAAELGRLHSYNQTPKQMLDEFQKLDPQGNVDRTLDRFAAQAPAVKQAEARLAAAKRDLALAELDLSYCDVVAEIDGVVTRRNVNPGNDVQVGQNLMAVRSLNEIWIDANFKETQLRDLRIGQAADLYVDMYGDEQVFSGRITGFTIGTGSTLALLPAQNATGNFIKIVQRLPVRIELENYDPDQKPLFIGASVVPYVYLNKPLSGPNAGTFLQAYEQQAPASGSAASPPGLGK